MRKKVQENDQIKGGFTRKLKTMQGTLERINESEQSRDFAMK